MAKTQGVEVTESKKPNKSKKKVKVYAKNKKKNDPESVVIEKLIASYEQVRIND